MYTCMCLGTSLAVYTHVQALKTRSRHSVRKAVRKAIFSQGLTGSSWFSGNNRQITTCHFTLSLQEAGNARVRQNRTGGLISDLVIVFFTYMYNYYIYLWLYILCCDYHMHTEGLHARCKFSPTALTYSPPLSECW